MKPIKQTETTIFVFVSSPVIQKHKFKPPKKPKIDKYLLKAIALIIITLVSWLNPGATVAIALVKLLFLVLEWLNQKDNF
jgi:hypothetical protein